MVHVIVDRATGKTPLPESGAVASIAVDSGSRGVVLRRGSDMESLIRVPHDAGSAAPAIVRGETVKVRRLRGVGLGEIELNPRHPWRFQIQGPTWNTVLEVGRPRRAERSSSTAARRRSNAFCLALAVSCPSSSPVAWSASPFTDRPASR